MRNQKRQSRLSNNVTTAKKHNTHSRSRSSSSCYWTLYDIVAFSCAAVRSSSLSMERGVVTPQPVVDGPLLEFVFRMFLQSEEEDYDHDTVATSQSQNNATLVMTGGEDHTDRRPAGLSHYLTAWQFECDKKKKKKQRWNNMQNSKRRQSQQPPKAKAKPYPEDELHHSTVSNDDDEEEEEEECVVEEESDYHNASCEESSPQRLSLVQVGNMVLSLLDLYHYRNHVDLNPPELVKHQTPQPQPHTHSTNNTNSNGPSGYTHTLGLKIVLLAGVNNENEDVWISCADAILMGLVPTNFTTCSPDSIIRSSNDDDQDQDEDDAEFIPLRSVVQHILDSSLAAVQQQQRRSRNDDSPCTEAETTTGNDRSPVLDDKPTGTIATTSTSTSSMSLEQFVAWHSMDREQYYRRGANNNNTNSKSKTAVQQGSGASSNSNSHSNRKRRLGLLLQELRLVATVIFGIKPSTPKQERDVIRELYRRHKLGHPEAKGMPRGPEGTLWFLIHSNWMDQWNVYTFAPPPASSHHHHPHERSHSGNTSFASSTMATRNDGNPLNTTRSTGTVEQQTSSSASMDVPTPPFEAPPMPPPVPPPPIDNHVLLRQGSLVLRGELRHVRDFLLVPPLVWSALQAWHDGGTPIERKVVRQAQAPTSSSTSSHQRGAGAASVAAIQGPDGYDSSPSSSSSLLECEVELYPYCLTIALADSTTGGQPRPFQQWQLVSRIEPTRQLLESLCQSLNIPTDKARLWKLATPQSGSADREDRLLDLNISLGAQLLDHRVEDGAVLMIELYNDEAQCWPRDFESGSHSGGASFRDSGAALLRTRRSNKAAAAGEGASQVTSAGQGQGEPQGSGIVGLYNMGNTCYLNSSMQCLSHTPLLKEYFTSKSYLNDINTTNPLGQQGRLAQVFATLLLSLWKPGPAGTSLTPKTFKDALGKFNDHFAGNEQHDAQEVLAFLLSGLSEDLNRIVDKPYIEQPDSDGRPDKELADIWWKNHLRREMSIIVALFTGQYKSCLTCNTCHYSSSRFEPFAFLQLPLPEDDLIPVTLIHYPIEHARPILKYSVRVNKDGLIDDSLMALSKVLFHDELAALRGRASTSATSAARSSSGNLGKWGSSSHSNINSNTNNNSEAQLRRIVKRRLLRLKDEDALEDEYDKDEEMFLRQVASNLAVVDMRECRINSITPSTRSLSQIRESDVLCTFELDPVPTETKYIEEHKQQRVDEDDDIMENVDGDAEGDNDASIIDEQLQGQDKEPGKREDENANTNTNTKEEEGHALPVAPKSPKMIPVQIKLRPDYIALVQRRLEPLSRPYLHEFTMRIFGTPLLLRIMLKQLSAPQLYDLIASRIHRLVPSSANTPFVKKKKHAPRPSPPPASLSATTTPHQHDSLRKTTMEMEQVAGGSPMPRYGFRLRLTSRDGKRCSRCPWYECCIGCEILDMDFTSGAVAGADADSTSNNNGKEENDSSEIIQDGDTLAIDWHLSSDAVSPAANPDFITSGGSSTLHNSNMSAYKEQSLMLARVQRHKSCQFEGKDITLEECLDNFTKEEEIPDAYCSKCKDFRSSVKHMNLWRVPPILIIHLKRFQFTQHFRRKLRNMVVFPTDGLDISHIIAASNDGDGDGQANDMDMENTGDSGSNDNDNDNNPFKAANGDKHDRADADGGDDGDDSTARSQSSSSQTSANDDGSPQHQQQESKWVGHSDGRSESLYDLYAVVHHLGALTGGHYVASVRTNTDGKWKLFNDALVTEISSRDIIDASAYILFYVRRDVKNAPLSDLWDVTSRAGEGLTEEQIDKLVRQRERCVVS
jgi:ubiquitin C-terminal hydrolase